jgi:hypothetical protein
LSPCCVQPAFSFAAIDFPADRGKSPIEAGKIDMKTRTKAAVIGIAAITTIASTLSAASAGQRDYDWRRHHGGRHFNDRAIAAGVIGLTAGVIVGSALAQPRVVYRERPLHRPAQVIVDEGPLYADPDVVYVAPDEEYIERSDAYADPDSDDRYGDDTQSYDRLSPDRDAGVDDASRDETYFPDRPERNRNRATSTAQGTLEPWTAEWRSYCKQRFQSFNATTGTYRGYDGKNHFCTAG